MTTSPTEPNRSQANGAGAHIDELDLKPKVAEVLDRWPSVGRGERGFDRRLDLQVDVGGEVAVPLCDQRSDV